MSRETVAADIVVIGAGIVGLATARALQQRRPGTDVLVIDKEAGPARHQTGRNSGVVHSGLYYRPGSAKAELVRTGRTAILEFCAAHDVPHDVCGKVVVATRSDEVARLHDLAERARQNDVAADWVGPAELHRMEPEVAGIAALHVPSAAITDFGAVAAALVDDLTSCGTRFEWSSPLSDVEVTDSGLRVRAGAHDITARRLVNCAGMYSDRVAHRCGVATDVRILPFRGEYYELVPAARHLVRHLVYPVPDPRWPFLGVHFTRMVDGGIHVGPNAVLSPGREAYRRGSGYDEVPSYLTDPALRQLARAYWRTGLSELRRSRSLRHLVADARRLVPALTPGDLTVAPAGIRAQAVRRDGTLLDDFEFADSPHAVHVLNAPSPAATASFAIGELVAERVLQA